MGHEIGTQMHLSVPRIALTVSGTSTQEPGKRWNVYRRLPKRPEQSAHGLGACPGPYLRRSRAYMPCPRSTEMESSSPPNEGRAANSERLAFLGRSQVEGAWAALPVTATWTAHWLRGPWMAERNGLTRWDARRWRLQPVRQRRPRSSYWWRPGGVTRSVVTQPIPVSWPGPLLSRP